MKRYLSFAVAFLAVVGISLHALAADPMPSGDQPYAYMIYTTNGAGQDAGTVHDIYFTGMVGAGEVGGSFAVSPEPNGMDQDRIGPFATPLNSLYFLLNGSDFDAPDNWQPVRIRVVELIDGQESRVVVDHNPWEAEFNSVNRSHQIFAPY